MLDVSVAYNRFRFLGQEFLTWLWFLIATEKYKDLLDPKKETLLSIGDRMVLENRHAKDIEIITIKGDQADLKEGIVALSKGALVTELAVVYQRDGQSWQFTLKGESLGITNLKTPTTGSHLNNDEIEGAVLEKVYLYETVFDVTDLFYNQFIKERISENWNNSVQTAIIGWIRSTDKNV